MVNYCKQDLITYTNESIKADTKDNRSQVYPQLPLISIGQSKVHASRPETALPLTLFGLEWWLTELKQLGRLQPLPQKKEVSSTLL